MFWKRLLTLLKLLLLGLLFVVAVSPEWPAFQDERYEINAIVGQRMFDFVVWEWGALSTKGEAALTAGQDYLAADTRKQMVLNHLQGLGEVRQLEAQISAIYADPNVDDPAAASQELQAEVNERRRELAVRQPMAEAIMQEQVATILVEEGLEVLDQAWPPVLMHMTPLPFILVVSPREEIRQLYSISLEPGLTLGDQEQMENAIYEGLDRSALVVPIGGIGLYPSMVLETSNINFLADTVAHEWAHHWLTLHPIGLSYQASPALRTVNETAASIVGTEIGKRVIERYYPEFVRPEQEPEAQAGPEEPPAFDFNAEMAKTRSHVDELLAQGRVEEAEQYMEERRQFFWDQGYRIRKLNQAYFAFYGAYAETPGEQGDDPIGPAVVAVRDSSPSLRVFLDRLAPITSIEALLREAEAG